MAWACALAVTSRPKPGDSLPDRPSGISRFEPGTPGRSEFIFRAAVHEDSPDSEMGFSRNAGILPVPQPPRRQRYVVRSCSRSSRSVAKESRRDDSRIAHHFNGGLALRCFTSSKVSFSHPLFQPIRVDADFVSFHQFFHELGPAFLFPLGSQFHFHLALDLFERFFNGRSPAE